MSEENHEENSEDISKIPPNAARDLAWAMMEFNCKFSEYIKEMNPDLWKKAVDYAVTFTKVNGITFEYIKTDTSEDVVATVDIDRVDIDESEEGEENDEWTDLEDDRHS